MRNLMKTNKQKIIIGFAAFVTIAVAAMVTLYVGLYETRHPISKQGKIPYEKFLSYAAVRAKYHNGFQPGGVVEPDEVLRISLDPSETQPGSKGV